MEKIQILRQFTLFHKQKRKRKPNGGDIINQHRHLLQLPAIQVRMRNRIITGLKISPEMKNINGNHPKVSPTTQKTILKNTFQRIVWKRLYYSKIPSLIILNNIKKLDDFLRDILKEKHKTNEENILEKFQRKTFDVIGPLSKLWNILVGAKGAEQYAAQISVNDLFHYVE